MRKSGGREVEDKEGAGGSWRYDEGEVGGGNGEMGNMNDFGRPVPVSVSVSVSGGAVTRGPCIACPL